MTTNELVETTLERSGLPDVMTGVIDGKWAPRGEQRIFDVADPATERVLRQFESTSGTGIDDAVRSAHQAWDGWWRRTAPAERAHALLRAAEILGENAATLAVLESLDTGKPISQARGDIAVCVRYLEYYAGAADKFGGETIPQPSGTLVYTIREPHGVVAHITPWNSPISQMIRGIAPCLAVGNTVVVKPSELTPMTTTLVALLMAEAALPPGVCNVVLGDGPQVGQSLVRHELVRHVTFTGSVLGGREVGKSAADRIIGFNLELGGKSPTIVMPDANLDSAAEAGALAVIRNSGQSCMATTRLIVHRSVSDEFVEKVASRIGGLSLGHGLEDPDLGPLVSEQQRNRVLSFVEAAQGLGAEVVIGGASAGTGTEQGYFVAPTLITDVDSSTPIVREEVFGPVQLVMVFDDVDEAVDLANDTEYGLAAGIFTKDVAVAHHVAGRLQAGQVQINRYRMAGVEVPFGGYRNSGVGREKGIEALRHYTQVKSVIVDVPSPSPGGTE